MNIVRLLFGQFKFKLAFVFSLSIASAALAVKVISFTNDRLLQPGSADKTTLYEFAILLAGTFLIGTAAQIGMTALGHRLVFQLRKTMIKRILDTNLERLEELDPAHLLASLNSDINHLTTAFISLPTAVYGLVLNLGGFAYLYWLSKPLFVATICWMLVTVFVGWLLMIKTYARVDSARAVEDLLYEDYQATLMGRKELALNRNRAKLFYREELQSHAAASRDHEIIADIYNGLNENWANVMILGSIGLIFYLTYYLGLASSPTAATYSLTILFLRTSLTSIVAAVPNLIAGNVAIKKLNSLTLQDYRPEFEELAPLDTKSWHKLELANVVYRYPKNDNGENFAVGPLNFEMKQGETIFLIGGNGSGKSTFSRLLTGLYLPQQGQVKINGIIINNDNRDIQRQLFSSVFSDFHLFHQLLADGENKATSDKIGYWLDRLEISHKVDIKDSTIVDSKLSQGQRKRLALLLAILEDRPILVLDEWAADQDPAYRKRFYLEIVPELKAKGKTLLAITHDEHYFHLADRVLKMDEGLLLDKTE